MTKTSIANRQPTDAEIAASKMAGTFYQFGRIMTEAGCYSMLRQGIDDPDVYRQALIDFHQNYVPTGLCYAALLKWFQENDLEKYLTGGSLEKQVKAQEVFYQKSYGKDFRINRKKIFVEQKRLPAIKKGLEIGAVNRVLVKAIPKELTAEEQSLTEAQFFAYRIMKKTGIKIWAETGTDRWTGKTFDECLAEYINVAPEDFNLVALRDDWQRECLRVANKKGSAPKVITGSIEISFVDGRQNVPAGQISNQAVTRDIAADSSRARFSFCRFRHLRSRTFLSVGKNITILP